MPLLHRTVDACRGSLDSFLASAMLFSIVMLSAAIYISAQGRMTRKSTVAEQIMPHSSATYDMILSLTAAGFAVFPVLVLYTLMGRRDGRRGNRGHTNHRTWLRRAVIAIIWVLLVVEVFMSPRGNLDYDQRHEGIQGADEDPCNKRGGKRYWQSMKAAQFLVIGAPILWMVVTVFLMTGFRIPGVLVKPWIRRVRSVWDLSIAWVNMALTWAILWYFSVLRDRIGETSGILNDQSDWGFGQILSLAAWVPIAGEFLYLFICKPPAFAAKYKID